MSLFYDRKLIHQKQLNSHERGDSMFIVVKIICYEEPVAAGSQEVGV